jgi:hypothetical protein
MWDQCSSYLENSTDGWSEMTRINRCRLIARRVARLNAMMVYGPEYLLI